MITYRTFRNDDPPRIAEVWNRHLGSSLEQRTLTGSEFEQIVLAKPYFDASRICIAEEGPRVVGFSHVVPPLSEQGDDGSADAAMLGSIAMLAVEPHADRAAIASELLSRGIQQLYALGCQRIQAGGRWPFDPFYWSLYGGCRSGGVLASDQVRLTWFHDAGFREISRLEIWRRSLHGFRPAVDRVQLQLKRNYSVISDNECSPPNWLAACAFGVVEIGGFTIRATVGTAPRATLMFGDLCLLSGSPGSQKLGLLSADLPATAFQDGVATFLLGESLRLMLNNGATDAEAVTPVQDTQWQPVWRQLGFTKADEAVVLELAPDSPCG